MQQPPCCRNRLQEGATAAKMGFFLYIPDLKSAAPSEQTLLCFETQQTLLWLSSVPWKVQMWWEGASWCFNKNNILKVIEDTPTREPAVTSEVFYQHLAHR